MSNEFYTDSGASKTFPQQAGLVRRGGFAMMDGRPCKVVEVSVSKTGKHGHAKAHIVGIDLYTSKKIETLCPTSHNMDIPVISRSDYTLMSYDEDNFCNLLSDTGVVKSDLQLPIHELGFNIRDAFDDGKEVTVTVLSAIGEEAIVSFKCTDI